jgi:hypothetical protein
LPRYAIAAKGGPPSSMRRCATAAGAPRPCCCQISAYRGNDK